MFKNLYNFIHVIIFSIYPVLYIAINNYSEMRVEETLSPIAILFFLAAIIFICANFFLKNFQKSTVFTSISMVFLVYVNLFYIFFETAFGINKILFLIICVTLSVIIGYLLLYKIKQTEKIIKIFNDFSIILIIISLMKIPPSYILSSIGNLKNNFTKKQGVLVKDINTGNNKYPNILYIILDGYASNNVLKKYYDYDNSEFTNWLENKGFYVAKNSTSNYSITHLSINSSLNMNYVHNGLNENNWLYKLSKTMENSIVPTFFKKMGYEFIIYNGSEYFREFDTLANKTDNFSSNIIIYLFIYKCSVLSFINDSTISIDTFWGNKKRNWMEKTFRSIKEICGNPKTSNKFIYVHLIAPHPPFLYDKDDKQVNIENGCLCPMNGWSQKKPYIDYLIYTNKKIKNIIEEIITKSPNNNIIILQADHGSQYYVMDNLINLDKKGCSVRISECGSIKKKYCSKKIPEFASSSENIEQIFGILNAVYIPKNKPFFKEFNNGITPVNTFRIISNNLFNTNYPLLENKNYFTYYGCDYQTIDVTQKIKSIRKK